MSREWLIELGLQERRAPRQDGLAAALRPVVDRALDVLTQAIQSGDDGDEQRHALAEISRCREVFGVESEPARIDSASQALFATCEATLRSIAGQRTARQAEITALITLVREAVATIAGSNRTFDSSLGQTTARFEAMAQCDNLQQLKDRLTAEVTVLKQIAVERQKSWEQTVSVFETRVADLEQQLVTTRREASLDPLTRIPNRRTFDRLCRDWFTSGRSQFVLALIDLDDFKQINDTHGHSVGDHVLQAVAKALQISVRSSDLVARLGGDEFGVLASGVTLRQAEGRMKAVTAQLAQASVIPGEATAITVSCGIAEFSAGDTIDSLMRRADQALYEAKRLGKNRVATRAQAFIRDLLGG